MMAVAMVAVATTLLAEDKVAATAAAPATAPAAVPATTEKSPDTGLAFATTLDFYSAYVWRGNVINDRPVWQPGATASYLTGDYGTLSANVWANFDATHRAGHTTAAGLNEIDYTLSYTKDVGPFSLEAGHIWYTFPKLGGKTAAGEDNYFASTREIYGGVAYNNDIVTPFAKMYGDYAEVNGLYATTGLRKSVSLTDQLTLGGEASIGSGNAHYMEYYFGGVDSGIADGDLSVSLTYALTDHVSVGAKLAWMSVLDSDARDAINNSANGLYFGKTDTLWGGLNLAASF